MTEKHPGGSFITRHLIQLSGIKPDFSPLPKTSESSARQHTSSPCRILDMGAGDGQTVKILLEQGFDAIGIDLKPDYSKISRCISDSDCTGRSESAYPFPVIVQGDFLNCSFESKTFDAIISECAFFISGNAESARNEAARLLKKGGLLLLADVSFTSLEQHISDLNLAGFSVLQTEDITPLWKEYYISCIWNDTVQELCPHIPKGKCSYYLTICERM